ncbi:MAG: GxxExxY protein [candidate division Zixibacteria bacterium]
MEDSKLAIRESAAAQDLKTQVIDAALEVHKNIGLGFGKQEYSRALAHELGLRDIPFERKKKVKLSYKGSVAGEYNLDFVVDNFLVIFVSTEEQLSLSAESKLKSILRSVKLKSGLILNFSKEILEIKTVKR